MASPDPADKVGQPVPYTVEVPERLKPKPLAAGPAVGAGPAPTAERAPTVRPPPPNPAPKRKPGDDPLPPAA